MKVLINKTHEIEVDEKFRDMFPMKGCEGLGCTKGCPFGSYQCCRLNSEIKKFIAKFDFTAEIVEDKIDFSKLKIGQKVWHGNKEKEIYEKVEGKDGFYVGFVDGKILPIQCLTLTPPPKKKVTKTVEAVGWVEKSTGWLSLNIGKEPINKDKYIEVELSGTYTIEE